MTKQAPHLLPPNATRAEIAIIQAVLKQFNKLPDNVKRNLWNADTCPLELLPWLAWARGVEVWDSTWPESIQRTQVKNAIKIARKRGTLGSIEDVLKSFGGSFVVREWWEQEPPGVPHTFELTLSINPQEGETITHDFIEKVMQAIDRTKPLRSSYTLIQGLSARGHLGIVGALRCGVFIKLKLQTDIKGRTAAHNLGVLGALRGITSRRLSLESN